MFIGVPKHCGLTEMLVNDVLLRVIISPAVDRNLRSSSTDVWLFGSPIQ